MSAPSKGESAARCGTPRSRRAPPLCAEVDPGTEPAAAVAEKVTRYRRFFRPHHPSARGHARPHGPVPYWTTLYGTSPYEDHRRWRWYAPGREASSRMAAVEYLTRDH